MSRRQPIADPSADQLQVFFPHSRKDYGSQRAVDAVSLIRRSWPGCHVLDPRLVDWKGLAKNTTRDGEVDELVVERCGAVVGLEKDGYIGRGVYGGLSAGLRLGKSVYVIREDKLHKVLKVVVHDPDDWAYKYGRVIVDRPL